MTNECMSYKVIFLLSCLLSYCLHSCTITIMLCVLEKWHQEELLVTSMQADKTLENTDLNETDDMQDTENTDLIKTDEKQDTTANMDNSTLSVENADTTLFNDGSYMDVVAFEVDTPQGKVTLEQRDVSLQMPVKGESTCLLSSYYFGQQQLLNMCHKY